MAINEFPFTQFNEENMNWIITTVKNGVGTAIQGVLLAGETSLTLESPVIKGTSLIDMYTSVYGLSPTTVSSGDGYVTMNFTAQADDVTVKIIVKNI